MGNVPFAQNFQGLGPIFFLSHKRFFFLDVSSVEGMPVVWMECHPDHTCGVEGRRGWGFGLAVPTEDNEAKLPSLPGKNPGSRIKDQG